MGQVQAYFGFSHVITVAEAAYVSIIVQIDRLHPEGMWVNNQMPEVFDFWPIRLKALYAEIYGVGTAIPLKGRPIAFHLRTSPSTALHLSYNIQGYIGRGGWQGDQYAAYGFGMTLRQGVVAAGDILDIGALYEPIR